MSLLKKIARFKQVSLDGFVSVLADGSAIGWMPPSLALTISEFSDVWFLDGALHLNPALASFDERTKAIDNNFVALSQAGLLPVMPDYSKLGDIDWFDVRATGNDAPLFWVKRFYNIYLGARFQSVVMNGHSGDRYWVARRSRHVHDSPGKLDLITAGCIVKDDTVSDTLRHEAWDEAGLAEADLHAAKNATVLRFHYLTDKGLFRNETMHSFDLDMTNGPVPYANAPHEVETLELMPVKTVLDLVTHTDEFKPEVVPVIVDFCLRHGYVEAGHPEFAALNALLYEEKIF